MAGIFARKWIASEDGINGHGGAVDGNIIQIWYQIAAAFAISLYAFTGTYTICYLINKIPGFHLRCSIEEENGGCDMYQMGEIGYEIIPYKIIYL